MYFLVMARSEIPESSLEQAAIGKKTVIIAQTRAIRKLWQFNMSSHLQHVTTHATQISKLKYVTVQKLASWLKAGLVFVPFGNVTEVNIEF